jgi:hypothetical protein
MFFFRGCHSYVPLFQETKRKFHGTKPLTFRKKIQLLSRFVHGPYIQRKNLAIALDTKISKPMYKQARRHQIMYGAESEVPMPKRQIVVKQEVLEDFIETLFGYTQRTAFGEQLLIKWKT